MPAYSSRTLCTASERRIPAEWLRTALPRVQDLDSQTSHLLCIQEECPLGNSRCQELEKEAPESPDRRRSQQVARDSRSPPLVLRRRGRHHLVAAPSCYPKLIPTSFCYCGLSGFLFCILFRLPFSRRYQIFS